MYYALTKKENKILSDIFYDIANTNTHYSRGNLTNILFLSLFPNQQKLQPIRA